MSKWTHIVGAIYLDTFRELDRNDLKEHIEGLVVKAPQITGSEENAMTFVNVLNGENTYVYNSVAGFQTCVVITVVGDLRDRDRFETIAETKAFIEYFRKNLYIMMYSFAIEDDSGYKVQLQEVLRVINNCPNCSAPIVYGYDHNCPYCNTFIKIESKKNTNEHIARIINKKI